jgi:hypothetical protein
MTDDLQCIRADRKYRRHHPEEVGEQRRPADQEPEVGGDRPPTPCVRGSAVHPPHVQPPVCQRDSQHWKPGDRDRDRAGVSVHRHQSRQRQRQGHRRGCRSQPYDYCTRQAKRVRVQSARDDRQRPTKRRGYPPVLGMSGADMVGSSAWGTACSSPAEAISQLKDYDAVQMTIEPAAALCQEARPGWERPVREGRAPRASLFPHPLRAGA